MEISEKELSDQIVQAVNQSALFVISQCVEICDKNRGYLDVGDKILKHFQLSRPEPVSAGKKPALKVIK